MAIKPTYEELEQRAKELESRLEQLEETLRVSVERNRLATSAAKVGVWDWNIKTSDFYLDPNIKAILGYADDEIPNDIEIWVKYVHPEDSKAVMEAAQACLDGKTSEYIFEHRMLHKDGSNRWILVRGKAIRDENGNAVRLIGTDADITERKRAEEVLRESEEKYRRLIEDSIDGIAIVAGIEVKFVNQAVLKMWGYESEKEIVGKPFTDLVAPKDREMMIKRGGDRENGKNVINRYKFTALRKDGTEFIAELSVSRIIYQGKVARQGLLRDITQQKLTEEELKESEERYRTLVETMSDGLGVQDENGIITYVNDRLYEMWGYSRDEIIGHSVLAFLDEANRNELEEQLALRSKGKQEPFEIEWTGNGERKISTLMSPSPLFDVEGNFKGSFAVITDITERKQVEEALRESEERYRSFVQNFQGIAFRGKMNFTPIFFHGAVEEITGYTENEFIAGKPRWDQVIHSDDLFTFFREDEKKLHSVPGYSYEREYRIVCKDGQIRWAHEVIRNICDDVGQPAILQGAIYDITERKLAEKALQESEEVYRTLVESANSIILKWDTNGHIIYLNPYGLEYFKYGKEEVIGKHVIGTIVPENETTGRDLSEMMDNITKNPLKYKNNLNQNLRSDGELVWVAWTNEAILDESGKFVEILSIGNDITERKQAEEALRESEERFRTFAEFTYDWESWIGPDGKYIYVSPSCARITGYSPKEFLKSPGLLESITHPDDRKKISVHLNDHLKRDGEVLNIDFRIISRSDNTRWISHICQPVYDRDGNWAGMRESNRDITEQREVEAQLQRAEKMEAIGTLAGRVAHDLNNVLSGIVSYPDLLLMELPEDSPLRKPILTMKNSGEKAVDIVQDLLTMARRGVVVADLVNLNDIISEYLISAEHERLISYHHGVEVKTKLEADLLNLSGSPVHLSKIVMNLVSNAAEAISHGGKIFISTENRYVDRSFSRYDSIKEGDYVVLAVSDKGVGISSQDIEKIFEPFYTKKVMGRSGTGLGMTVVWGTVKDHNGYIDVQSTEGKGTKFTLYFPATREKIAKEKARLSIENYIGKEESILVVDDVKEQRELALTLLTTLDYAVDTVSSGEEAVKYLKEHTVDLIVLDMIMDPGIDGLETYKKIIEVHPGQKAIIASGFSETDRVKEAQRLGAGQYIKKPYTLEKIGLAIKEELGK